MPVRLTILGSGSAGNCAYVETDEARVLIDAGFSLRQIRQRLATIGRVPENLTGILVTHEHSDHVSGVHVMAKKFRLPVYMTAPTHAAWQRQYKDSAGNRVRAERLEPLPLRGLKQIVLYDPDAGEHVVRVF